MLNELKLDDKLTDQSQPVLVSDRDWDVYRAIVSFKMDHDGCAPQLRELMEMAHMSSTSVVTHHLARLARAGLIEYGGKARTIHVRGGRWLPPEPVGLDTEAQPQPEPVSPMDAAIAFIREE